MKKERTKKAKSYDYIPGQDRITEPEQESRIMLASVKKTEHELQELYTKLAESGDSAQYTGEVTEKLRSYHRTSDNLGQAYYAMLSAKDELNARYQDLTKSEKRKLFLKAPANSVIDLEEQRSAHFARGLNLYKILMIGYIGSFIGVVIEMIWCLLTRGYIESRAGLVYGPFNLLYGAGAIAMTLALYRYRNKGRWISFLGGFVVGGVLEYICSWMQEVFFGSRSWDYSHMPFNINGRVCLLYSVFWGILGIAWVKYIYPWMAKLILKLPEKSGKVLTWALLGFFALNALITVIAVFRWSQRIHLVAPENAFWELIDMRFPNERMEKIFANMVFG